MFFFFKQKTADEMRISDWSSDVCSSDLDFSTVVSHIRESLSNYFRSRMSEQSLGVIQELKDQGAYPYDGEPKDEVERRERQVFDIATYAINMRFGVRSGTTIGRASCRERVCQQGRSWRSPYPYKTKQRRERREREIRRRNQRYKGD